jgi:predicted ArsR family transcriptional regulator
VDDLDSLALLADPQRRAAYDAVVDAAPDAVGRDEVASALGVGRTLAAFHLDKLVAAGLLDVSFARRSGRTGPGAGRPAKLYRRASVERSAAVPPRTYRPVAELLAEAVERAGVEQVAYEVARAHGAGENRPVPEALADRGYEPTETDGTIRLRNCPFHSLAEAFPPLVCGMNLALIEGLTAGTPWAARLDPAPGHCCVTLSKSNESNL